MRKQLLIGKSAERIVQPWILFLDAVLEISKEGLLVITVTVLEMQGHFAEQLLHHAVYLVLVHLFGSLFSVFLIFVFILIRLSLLLKHARKFHGMEALLRFLKLLYLVQLLHLFVNFFLNLINGALRPIHLFKINLYCSLPCIIFGLAEKIG